MTAKLTSEVENLGTVYRARDDWDCVPELLHKIAALTGSAGCDDSAFDNGVLLYGAGSIGAGALEYFSQKGIKVLGFLDDTPGRESSSYRGVDIVPLNFALRNNSPVVISMKNWIVPAAKLAEKGQRCESFAHYVVRTDWDRLETVAKDILSDDRSRLVYLTILKANLLSDYSLYPAIYEDNQYWAIPGFQYLADPEAVMVDAGAYVGQILEEFVWRSHGIFKKIHAFEPNPKLHSALQARSCRLIQEWALPEDAITCVQAGLGDQETTLDFFESGAFNMAGGSFLFSQGKQAGSLHVKKLDQYLAGGPVTFLKADVEGFEMPLIRGASASIKTHRPKLALSIYHRINDLFDIPLALRSLVPDYKMAVRHHTPSQEDSVLYCWV